PSETGDGSALLARRHPSGLRQLLDVDVAEPEVVAVVLQLDRAGLRRRLAAEPVVRQRGLVDDLLAVEYDGHLVADHRDVERLPLADRLVRLLQRNPANLPAFLELQRVVRRFGDLRRKRVVPQSAGPSALVLVPRA